MAPLTRLLWLPVAAATRVLAILAGLITSFFLTPFKTHLTLLSWVYAWGLSLACVVLVVGLVIADLAVVTLEQAVPGARGQVLVVGAQLGGVGVAGTLLVCAAGWRLWREGRG